MCFESWLTSNASRPGFGRRHTPKTRWYWCMHSGFADAPRPTMSPGSVLLLIIFLTAKVLFTCGHPKK